MFPILFTIHSTGTLLTAHQIPASLNGTALPPIASVSILPPEFRGENVSGHEIVISETNDQFPVPLIYVSTGTLGPQNFDERGDIIAVYEFNTGTAVAGDTTSTSTATATASEIGSGTVTASGTETLPSATTAPYGPVSVTETSVSATEGLTITANVPYTLSTTAGSSTISAGDASTHRTMATSSFGGSATVNETPATFTPTVTVIDGSKTFTGVSSPTVTDTGVTATSATTDTVISSSNIPDQKGITSNGGMSTATNANLPQVTGSSTGATCKHKLVRRQHSQSRRREKRDDISRIKGEFVLHSRTFTGLRQIRGMAIGKQADGVLVAGGADGGGVVVYHRTDQGRNLTLGVRKELPMFLYRTSFAFF
ncbi:hypothetical protein D9613_012616 [Agrocybe pediades]|uniref:Uncharacterized protein n=1 Tax=Agrocybe pediades TaxID=84607 RepID=A0A8H4VSW4_9AGAR|nr:hypothetical protein D9613_012616 [Agrocybe pediades]